MITAVQGWLRYQDYELVAALFIRILGIIYLIAFASLLVQIQGLVGSGGILPVGELLDYVDTEAANARFYRLPTIFWLDHSNIALVGATIYGCVVSVQILFNWWQRPALILAFILYLSLFNVCQPFLHFQWDGLLLEAGFLAIFLGSRSSVIIWLFRWLLFKLRFMSGLSKLTSGDPAWSGLTALNTYFEVQPLPNPLAWYVHHLPEWLLRSATAATLFIEIIVPLMMFMPRRWRFAAAWITIIWQLLIIFTSNHNWINLLTIALCLFLFDDKALRRVLPTRFALPPLPQPSLAKVIVPARSALITLMAAFILIVSFAQLWVLSTKRAVIEPVQTVLDHLESYRVVNMYHVFPTMTTERIELEIAGSHDGREWKQYRFKYKPEELDQRPQWIMPHQPRLDWQMWFVTLSPKHLPWFEELLYTLLEESHDVDSLLQHNPFPEQPPRFIKVDAYRYTFTTPEQRAQTGHWWQREAQGPFLPLPAVYRIPEDEL
ncbi:MAG: lipase maturation factor family protein [Gammaproteobacteria bacterium]|nr:lipase maturation factor family protein [Gammaproteobacteria bacterium]